MKKIVKGPVPCPWIKKKSEGHYAENVKKL
jgi:hypothetical protein